MYKIDRLPDGKQITTWPFVLFPLNLLDLESFYEQSLQYHGKILLDCLPWISSIRDGENRRISSLNHFLQLKFYKKWNKNSNFLKNNWWVFRKVGFFSSLNAYWWHLLLLQLYLRVSTLLKRGRFSYVCFIQYDNYFKCLYCGCFCNLFRKVLQIKTQ